MTKKVINQKGKFNEELLNTIEPNFVFQDKPINRFNIIKNSDNFNQANKNISNLICILSDTCIF